MSQSPWSVSHHFNRADGRKSPTPRRVHIHVADKWQAYTGKSRIAAGLTDVSRMSRIEGSVIGYTDGNLQLSGGLKGEYTRLVTLYKSRFEYPPKELSGCNSYSFRINRVCFLYRDLDRISLSSNASVPPHHR